MGGGGGGLAEGTDVGALVDAGGGGGGPENYQRLYHKNMK